MLKIKKKKKLIRGGEGVLCPRASSLSKLSLSEVAFWRNGSYAQDSCRTATENEIINYASIHWEKLQCQQWCCRR